MNIELQDGHIQLIEEFIPQKQADLYLQALLEQVQWEQRSIRLFGKSFLQPRLTAWYGDPQKTYTYSGISWEPLPWTPLLLEMKDRVEQAAQHPFNSVLLNLYRNGQDSMGWHSDDEPELGKNPCIASVSLGQSRTFHLRHRSRPQAKPLHLLLTHGSLLLMQGSLQHHWKHQLPKSRKKMGPRINLTFRYIH
ncbi:MAG: alpha-ketoglutarate-dependent dioxygenase AlkB [Bacteroidetes bacterium]|nr:MAG: alpha-ketoglutarate-dependent dioxygenase AlkB [Bacteroidota bacterium]